MMGEFKVRGKAKNIELLKSQILEDVSKLYTHMIDENEHRSEHIDILADMIISIHLLSNEMGTSSNGLEIKIVNKLKLALLDDRNSYEWKHELSKLKRYYDK